jgi:hypothetical protein
MPAREKEIEKEPHSCQAVSPWDEPCLVPATRHCERCGGWFCQAHFGDPNWHPCSEQFSMNMHGIVRHYRSTRWRE